MSMTRDMGSRTLVVRISLTLFLLLALAASGLAQISAGSIVGTVRDSSGALVPNATVAVTNKATGVTVTTATNAAGEFQVLALNPGTYSVKAGAPGFASQVRSGIEI